MKNIFRKRSNAEKIYDKHVRRIKDELFRSCIYKKDLDFNNDIIASTFVISSLSLAKAHDKEWLKLFLTVITVNYIKPENIKDFLNAVEFYEDVSRGKRLRADCILGAQDIVDNTASKFTIALGDRYTNPMLISDYDNGPTMISDIFLITKFCKETLSKISNEFADLYNELLICEY